MVIKSNTNYLRRRFLRLIASGTLAYTAGVNAIPKQGFFEEDVHNFADFSGLGPPVEGAFLEDHYCPLHDEKIYSHETIAKPLLDEANNLLKQEFEKQNIAWKDSYKIIWTSQHYGVPDRSLESLNLLRHCKNAHEYLYDNISGLLETNLNWELLYHRNNLKNCPSDTQQAFTAYVGRYIYLAIRISAVDENNNPQGPYLIYPRPLERSINLIRSSRATNQPTSCKIYIIPGITALISPFSELLHLSTSEPTLHYAEEIAKSKNYQTALEEARTVGETVTEAISIVLAWQYFQTKKRTNRLNQINALTQHMRSYLPNLNNILAFATEYGVQQCYSDYKNSPQKFVRDVFKFLL